MDEVLLIFSGQEANGQERGRFHTTKNYPTTSKLFMIRGKLIYNYVSLEFKYIFHINTMYSCRLLIRAEVFKNVKFGTFSRAIYHFSSPVQKITPLKETPPRFQTSIKCTSTSLYSLFNSHFVVNARIWLLPWNFWVVLPEHVDTEISNILS